MPVCELAQLSGLLKAGTCLLGLDPGKKRIGVAISDPALRVASPLTVIERGKFAADAAALALIINERKVGGLIIGLPKSMDGSEGPPAQAARAFARNLLRRDHLLVEDIPIVFWDERFSTAAVEREMIAHDITRTRRAAKIDSAAAAYILQGVLDAISGKQMNYER